MRILVLSNFYEPHTLGGYERLCARVVDGLAGRGDEVAVLTSDFGGDVTVPERRRVMRDFRLLADSVDPYAPFQASEADRLAIEDHNAGRFAAHVAELRPDLVFVWNLFFLGRSLLPAVLSSGVPTAFFLTDNWLVAAEAPERVTAFFDRHVHAAEPFVPEPPIAPAIEYAAHAIFGAGFVRDFHRWAGFRFRAETVIHNGIDLPPGADDYVVERSRLRRPDRVDLLFAGRVVQVKGVLTAVEALAHLRRRHAGAWDIRLTVVGDRRDAAFGERLRACIAEHGLDDVVTQRDPVPEAGLFALFNEHDIHLFPSLWEPFSLTLVHSLASGIPTIASRAGGNAEIVEDGHNGLLFTTGDSAALADAVTRLLAAPASRAALAVAARRTAGRFTFARMLDRIELALRWT